MDESTLQSIKDAVFQNDRIAIAVGKNPTLDEMGAALALYLSLKEIGKNAAIACPTEPIVEISSLVGIDKVINSLDGEGGDLIVSFPYTEGEIEKVSYTLEDGFLNILVKAGEIGLSFSEKDIKYKRKGNIPALLFVVGTPTLSALGNIFDPEILKDTMVVNIDNKSENQGFGDIVFVSPKFSSVSEQVANFFTYGDFQINVDTAQNLLSGISFATNNFQHPKTSSIAFEMAGILMRKGAVRGKTSSKISSVDDFSFNPVQHQAKNQPRQFSKNTMRQTPLNQNQVGDSLQPFPSQKTSGQKKDEKQEKKDDQKETPSDWLTPKVYKSSNLI